MQALKEFITQRLVNDSANSESFNLQMKGAALAYNAVLAQISTLEEAASGQRNTDQSSPVVPSKAGRRRRKAAKPTAAAGDGDSD